MLDIETNCIISSEKVDLGHFFLRSRLIFIRIICPCNVYSLAPHFYIVKLGFTRGYILFLFLL